MAVLLVHLLSSYVIAFSFFAIGVARGGLGPPKRGLRKIFTTVLTV